MCRVDDVDARLASRKSVVLSCKVDAVPGSKFCDEGDQDGICD